MNLKEFSDSLKKVFGSLLPLKTADSNYAVGLFNKADGTPAGMMDMSALASVLGVLNTDFSTGMTTGYGEQNVPLKLFDVDESHSYIFLFFYSMRFGIYSAAYGKINTIVPAAYLQVGQQTEGYMLYVDGTSVYFKNTTAFTQTFKWKVVKVFG